MHPIKYAVQNASTDVEVFEGLTSFLDYLRSLGVYSVLPEKLSTLSARDADEIRTWSARLAQEAKNTDSLTVAGDLWFKEVREAFAAAVLRLNEIAETEPKAAAGAGRVSESGAGFLVERR
ncbi:MAG TPA: hypothetical protein VGQ19_13530 [Burkholderiales bacterium]|jgi:hypothetical protein|nr:hypothetical protein [Burkholderiales bacterium]